MSSQGWYIPRVTQLIRITVIVSLSNHLEKVDYTVNEINFLFCSETIMYLATMKLAILQNSDVMEKTVAGFGLSDRKLCENNRFYFRTVLAVDLC